MSSNPSGAVGVTTHPVGGFPQQPWRVEKRPLVRPLGPGGDLKCRFGAARCRSLMQQLHAGVERTVQDICHKKPTSQPKATYLPSSSNSTAQDKLPPSRVLRLKFGMSRTVTHATTKASSATILKEKTCFGFFSWICNGRPTGKKEEIWRMGLNETHKVHQATPPIVWAGNQYSPLLGKRRKDSTYGCALHSICQCRSRSGSETGRLSRQGA